MRNKEQQYLLLSYTTFYPIIAFCYSPIQNLGNFNIRMLFRGSLKQKKPHVSSTLRRRRAHSRSFSPGSIMAAGGGGSTTGDDSVFEPNTSQAPVGQSPLETLLRCEDIWLQCDSNLRPCVRQVCTLPLRQTCYWSTSQHSVLTIGNLLIWHSLGKILVR